MIYKAYSYLRFFFHPKRVFFTELKNILGFYPKNPKLYELAFVHKSASVKLPNGIIVNNERLEYLGDSILDAIISDYLFHAFPFKDEGFLSQMRSKIVKRKHINHLASKIGIKQLLISNTDHLNGIKNIYGDAFEALIGAIYLDKGFRKARRFIIKKLICLYVDLPTLESTESDFKSRIIEWAQKNKQEISFENHEEYTEDTHTPTFISKVKIKNEYIGKGKGLSKKEAEQNAAMTAFQKLLPAE